MNYATLAKQFKVIEEGVRSLLEDKPELRRKDTNIDLILAYWEKYNGIKLNPDVKSKVLRHATDPETILRRRRELQHRGLYIAGTETVKERVLV